MRYSIIIPVYNRPEELRELLSSLKGQTFQDFEVIVVEDGSQEALTSQGVCRDMEAAFGGRLRYFMKPNSGPGQSRNYGAERARGEWVIVLDSDVVLPEGYLQCAESGIQAGSLQAFGGPDRAHESFSPSQKAINYAMTSLFTTGGIRGKKGRKMDKFYPRSFNMGIEKSLYRRLGGFSGMRFGEDIDFSIRLFKAGAKVGLIPEAWVWHKRRVDFRKFFKQVHNSGIARVNLYKKYPESLKVVHLLPMLFTVGCCLLVVAAAVARAMMHFDGAHFRLWYKVCLGLLLPLLLFSLVILVDSAIRNRSLKIGFLSVGAAFVELTGYGTGFLRAWWKRCVRGKTEFHAFRKNFYK